VVGGLVVHSLQGFGLGSGCRGQRLKMPKDIYSCLKAEEGSKVKGHKRRGFLSP
jgi:hypothetical protein